MSEHDSLIDGPEWEALVAAVCCESDAEQVVADEWERLAA